LNRTRARRRPRRLSVRLERYQPVGSIDYGFFDPKIRSYRPTKIEDEDDFEGEYARQESLVARYGRKGWSHRLQLSFCSA
jgi:hypothetical protein